MPRGTIGENIRRHRKELGLLQKELAEKIGVRKQIICLWETNKHYPSILTLCDLADFFGCSTDELLGRKCQAEEGR